MDRVSERVVMISGANRGVGRAIARRLFAEGYRLSLGVRKPDSIDLSRDFDGERVMVVAYDARSWNAAEDWVAATVARFGRLDGLVNNAAINTKVSVDGGDAKGLDAVWEVNVKGPFRLIQCALPVLRKCGAGRIVNVASLSGIRVKNPNAAYPMSKHALVALSQAVRMTAWEDGVRVTALCPGIINTDMSAGDYAFPPEEATQPEDLAALVSQVIALPNTASVSLLPVNCNLERTA